MVDIPLLLPHSSLVLTTHTVNSGQGLFPTRCMLSTLQILTWEKSIEMSHPLEQF